MATENPAWGYPRLVGALGNLGHPIGRERRERLGGLLNFYYRRTA